MDPKPWLRTLRGRAYVRIMSQWGEPLWIVVDVGFPLLSSMALALLYESAGMSSVVGFAILGGIMISFWGNVLWSMASQFSWDKQVGLFEIYISSPSSLSAILLGMSLGGIVNTAPSSIMVAILGWVIFKPHMDAVWPAVILTFTLTLAGLYSFGMTLSSLYLTYGREADTLNATIQEPISMFSGIYFPSIGQFSPFPFGVQAVASLIPLTIGMDALRKSLFFGEGIGAIWWNLAALAIMAVALLFIASKSLEVLEKKGRRTGSLTVRLR